MAIVKCRECNAEISSKAAACPKCGNPVQSSKSSGGGCGRIFVYALIGLAVLMVFVVTSNQSGSDGKSAKPASPADQSQNIDKSPAMQESRQKLIVKLHVMGVFKKVDCRNRAADVWVGSAFDALSFDDKQSFVSVFYAWCHDRMELGTFVKVRSFTTNKELGVYTADRGLRLE
jgi:hypothetical protein